MTEEGEDEDSSDPVVAMPRLVRGGSSGGCAKTGPHAAFVPKLLGGGPSGGGGAEAASQGGPPWVSASWLIGATLRIG